MAPLLSGWRNAANDASPVAVNLAPVNDYSNEYPFTDFMKRARLWVSSSSTAWDDGRAIDMDENFNVRSLRDGQFPTSVLFAGVHDARLNGQRFVLRWEGEGEFAIALGGQLSDIEPGRAIVTVDNETPDGAAPRLVALRIRSLDEANPLRDFRLTPEGGICRSDPLAEVARAAACPRDDYVDYERAAGDGETLFLPEFLSDIAAYRGLRFMDWNRTNNSPVSRWSERAVPSQQFWSTDRGVPYEVMAALVRLMDMDAWLTVPHLATDGYIAAQAALVSERFANGREVGVEYSNEVWNRLFSQATHARDRGFAEGLGDTPDDFGGQLRWYSRRAQEMAGIYARAFADQGWRPSMIFATQGANPWVTRQILKHEKAASVADAMAIAPYFGYAIGEAEAAAQIKADGLDGIFAELGGEVDLGRFRRSVPGQIAAVRAQVEEVRSLAPELPVIAYEGGQHLLAHRAQANDAELVELFAEANRDPRMGALYRRYLDGWLAETGQPFHAFNSSGGWGRFGYWGLKEYTAQPRAQAPKYDAVRSFIERTPLPRN